IPTEGPLSWSVPGCVSGWETLRARFGTRPLSQILAAAIDAAENGAPVPEVIANSWLTSAPALQATPEAAKAFLVDGQRSPQTGEVMKLPQLAATLKLIAAQGRDAFYKGPIAQKIVAYSETHGGYFSLPDFADHTDDWVDPVSTNYRGYDVWELPPNGQG